MARTHGFDRPIYAVPGNHDWDDGSLTGFMTHFARGSDENRVDDAGPAVRAVLGALGWTKWIWRGARPPRSERTAVRHALDARDARDARLNEQASTWTPR